MTDDSNPAEGPCPHCGHMNQFTWHLCDQCGQRLPWSRPKKAKALSEMTDEELAARFVGLEPKKTPYLLSLEGRKALWIIVTVVSLILGELLNRVFGLPF